MPYYDYKCGSCGHTFEACHKAGEPEPKTCPNCKRRALQKLFGMPAYHSHYSPMHPRANRGRGY